MKLPKGITGFSQKNDRLPQVNGKSFRGLAHAYALLFNASVLEIDSEVVIAKSYYKALLATEDYRFRLLQNHIHGYHAFARPEQPTAIAYVDPPKGSGPWPDHLGFQLLTREQLESRLEDHDLTDLTDGEHHEIRYWKPKRLGDLIFNDWD